MNRWRRYWFDDGGRDALAIVRICVAWAVLLSLARLATHPQLVAPDSIYRPVGVWMLLGHTPPPAILLELVWGVAWVSTLAMLFGLVTRAATAVSFVSAVAIASISFSGAGHWSHQYNVVFLAQLALLGARAGDAFSLDVMVRHIRGLPRLELVRAYQWSVRLVQLAVALMFVGACFHKLAHGHFTLRWALSDNLRHHLLVKYDLAGLERPPLVDWLLADVWRYRTAALLNLMTQLAPVLAILFVRRPFVRFACGVLFIGEVLGLGFVVDLWNLHWLPLAAVFVDWDRLVGWLARRPRPVPPTLVDWRPPRGPRIFIVAFVVYDVLTAFIPTLDQRLNTYPFSGFPMFATIRARPPYGSHQPYSVPGDTFTVIGGKPLEPYAQSWFDHTHRRLYRLGDPEQLRRRLAAIRESAQKRYPWFEITGLRHELAIFEAPAYPAPAHFERYPIAITGELLPDDTFRTVLGRQRGRTIELRPQHVDTAQARLVAYPDEGAEPRDLATTRDGDTFTLAAPLAEDDAYVVAVIGDTRWLVAIVREL